MTPTFPKLDISKLDVILGDAHVGTLAMTPEGSAAFSYSDEWLLNGFSISPFSLPLESGVFVAKSHPLDGLFGIFCDSLPDGWGRLLVDRMLRRYGVDPGQVDFLTRLAIVGSSGAGALEYRPILELPQIQNINNDLDAIANDCADVLAARDTDDLDTLFAMGGSSGGARPKVFYELDNSEWIVKFPSSIDPSDIGEQEYKLALAATRCGIEMPEVRLLPSKNCSGYFATKRFDRYYVSERMLKVHMASVAALLETTHRTPNLDYDLLMRLTVRLTSSAAQVEQMFRRMVFNVFCGNRDDHSKNFSFIYNQNNREAEFGRGDSNVSPGGKRNDDVQSGWILSPAYDITANSGMNGEHATTVNGKGRDITVSDMLEAAKRAGISSRRAKEIVEQIQSELR